MGTEFRRIFSNSIVMTIFFAAPIGFGILFGLTYEKGKIGELPIAVVDMDRTNTSDKFIDAFNDNEYLQVAAVLVDNMELKQEIIHNNFQAIITIPKGFEADINQRRYPEIQIDLNVGNILTANFASRGLQSVLGTLNAGIEIETLKKQGLVPELAATRFEAFKTNYNRLFNTGSNYIDFMWPGLIAAIMQQVFLLGLALVFARDFEDGYFSVLIQKSRFSFYHVALKAIPFYLLGAIIWAAVLLIHIYFNLTWNVMSYDMIVMVFLFSTACILLGMLVSVIIPNQLKATELLMVIATPSFVLSGFTWPGSGMPAALQVMGNALPITHFLKGFKKIAIYGGNLSDVKTETGALIWMCVIFLTAILLVLQIKINRWRKRHINVILSNETINPA